MKNISIEGLTEIGKGASGTVYQYDADRVIKLYSEHYSIEQVTRVYENTKMLCEKGIRTAVPYELVSCENRYGIVSEYLKGRILTEIYNDEGCDYEMLTSGYAEFIKKTNSLHFDQGEFPKMRDVLMEYHEKARADIPKDLYSKGLAFIEALPDENTFVHGDAHCDNIMVKEGEFILLDTDDVGVGPSVMELCGIRAVFNTFILSAGYSMVKLKPELGDLLWDIFLRAYTGLSDPEKLQKANELIATHALLRSLYAIAANPIPAEAKEKLFNQKREVIGDKFERFAGITL